MTLSSFLLLVCFQLRRERIAERMKALQELVPNSNRLDKSSMLDDIIDYVKFLQLQAKVRVEGGEDKRRRVGWRLRNLPTRKNMVQRWGGRGNRCINVYYGYLKGQCLEICYPPYFVRF